MRMVRNRRGLLLTLVSIIMLVLLVGELTTYELINIDYSQLASQSAVSLSSVNLASQLEGAMRGYLQSELLQSLEVISADSPAAMTANVAGFSGASTYITASNSVSLSPSSRMSLFAWVRPSGQTAIAQKTGSYGMYVAQSGQFSGYVGASALGCSSYPYALPNQSWSFVGFTYNGSAINEYVDGRFYCSASMSGAIPVTSGPLSFGGSGDGDGSVYGYLSDVQLYSSSLPPNSVALLYSRGPAGEAIQNSSLAAWWPLDGNADDASGNGNGGSATGVSYYGVAVNASASGLISGLMGNGLLLGAQTNMTASTLGNYVASLAAAGALGQLSLSVTNSSLLVYQYSRNRIGATYTALATVSSGGENYSVPISATAAVSTDGLLGYVAAAANSTFWSAAAGSGAR